jgi:hypothetical protein
MCIACKLHWIKSITIHQKINLPSGDESYSEISVKQKLGPMKKILENQEIMPFADET